MSAPGSAAGVWRLAANPTHSDPLAALAVADLRGQGPLTIKGQDGREVELSGETLIRYLARQHASLLEARKQVEELTAALVRRDREIATLTKHAAAVEQQARERVAAIQSSTSWRITLPLRVLGADSRPVRHVVNRVLRLFRGT